MIVLYLLLTIVGVYLTLYVLYDLCLLCANFIITDKSTSFVSPQTKFGIVIPAHNEELLLDRLLMSIRQQAYPANLIRTIVVADNCSDLTAEIGRKNGALVLERTNELLRGKGYAIKFALEQTRLSDYDALFIIDADSIIKNDLLLQLDREIRNGNRIIQCYNGVANPGQSWFTRLLDVSRTVGNDLLQPAKQKLGLSSNLMGNGMCFTSDVLRKYGWDAFTVGEDWEYYARLAHAGETVGFANKARVYHQESTSLKQATSQRMRWASGRFAVAGKYGLSLFFAGVMQGNIKKMDASLPLLFPNPSLGMNITILGLILSIPTAFIYHQFGFLVLFSVLTLIQISMLLIGVSYTREPMKNFLSLFAAPLFLVWKMGVDALSAVGLGRKKWVRTERKL